MALMAVAFEAATGEYDVLRDSRHKNARAARELADWLAWLELGGAAARTLDAYERTGAVLLRMYPNTPFTGMDDSHLSHCLMTFPAPSRRIRKAHLASWFKWGYKTRRIPANPVELLPDIKRGHPTVKAIFTEAEQALLEGLPSPDGHLMTVLFETGLRKEEACQLRLRRFDFERRLVVVVDGAKGSKPRVVPIVDRLASAVANLELLEGINPDEFLWYDRAGGGHRIVRRSKPIASTSFHRWWVRCLADAGVEYRKPHTTRHTFATRWRQRGLAVDEIQKLLGHASISTTNDLYLHLGVDDVAVRMRALLAENE